MSEQQKIFASLSGAFVAHLLLLFLIFLFLSTGSASSALKREARPDRESPKEVTILMSELMEQITTEPAVPEARPFISTDLNRPEDQAPEKARFESDRNTSAASELRSDPNLPSEPVPTLNGDNPLPHLTLQNRDFTEGRLDEIPSQAPSPTGRTSPASAAAAPMALPADSSQGPQGGTDTPPETPVQESNDRENQEGRKELPDERMALLEGLNEAEPDPDKQAKPGSDAVTSVQKSFLDPSDDPESPVSGPMSAEIDRTAARKGEESGEKNVTDPTQEKSAAADAPAEPGAASATSPANEGETLKSADEGLFSSGFSPEERQNVINGSLARVGQNAVDAEATALGRYKKAVRDAISSTWHRYRQKNGDFVTWGILKLEFTVDKNGKVRNLHITKNEANAILAEFSLKAIRDAELPPMPADVAASVGSQGLVIQYDIIIY